MAAALRLLDSVFVRRKPSPEMAKRFILRTPMSLLQLAARSLSEGQLNLLQGKGDLEGHVHRARKAALCHSCGRPSQLLDACLMMHSFSCTFQRGSQGSFELSQEADVYMFCSDCHQYWKIHGAPECIANGPEEPIQCAGRGSIFELFGADEEDVRVLAWLCEAHAKDRDPETLKRVGAPKDALPYILLTELARRRANNQ